MTPVALILILSSAFLHALYNCGIKAGGRGESYLSAILIVAAAIAWGVAAARGGIADAVWPAMPVIFATALCYGGYQVSAARAYRSGDVSTLYPLTVLGPVFIPLWSTLFLGEAISTPGLVGIAATAAGAALTRGRSGTPGGGTGRAGAGWALTASFVYSMGAALDKYGVSQVDVWSYMPPMLTLMAVNTALLGGAGGRSPAFRKFGWSVAGGGIALYLSFLLFRIALVETPVHLAASVRQTSILFAVALGVLILRERPSAASIGSATLIAGGVALLAIGRA